MCKLSFCRSFLQQAQPSASGRAGRFSAPRLEGRRRPPGGGPAWGPLLPAALRVHACAFSPARPRLWVRPEPQPGAHTYGPCLAVATRSAEEQETQRRLPLRKRQPVTPQKKTSFPSVSLQTTGDGGPAVAPIPSPKEGLSAPRVGELGANSRFLQADPATSVWLAGPRLKSETRKACGKRNVSAAMFHFLYTVHVCLPIVSGKKPL